MGLALRCTGHQGAGGKAGRVYEIDRDTRANAGTGRVKALGWNVLSVLSDSNAIPLKVTVTGAEARLREAVVYLDRIGETDQIMRGEYLRGVYRNPAPDMRSAA
jgi:hypothetical protein